MAVILRYNSTITGGLSICGNTLGLSKLAGFLLPGNVDSIGGFISTSTTIPSAPGWGDVIDLANNENITTDFTANSSAGYLDIPAGSKVQYAELFWSGVLINTNQSPSIDVTGSISIPVSLVPSGGPILHISPTTVTAQNFLVSPNINYVRSQDVTTIVNQYGSGAYTVGNVPSAMSAQDDNSNVAGWCIVVAYENASLKYRDLTIYALGDGVSVGTTITIPVSGFLTPSAGPVSGRVLIAAAEGDANKDGDMVILVPTIVNPVTLSGPNNPMNNFFGSQINDNNGNLDTRGTFGTRNADPFTFSTVYAGRQGFDVTNIDASAAFQNNQTSTNLVFTTVNDGYNPVVLSMQIDSNEPVINLTKSASLGFANIGDVLTYTIAFSNIGNLPAENALFIDTIPNGTSFVPGSLTINGIANPGNPQTGISIGSIPQNATFTVVFSVNLVTIPNPNPIANIGNLIYEFQPLPGSPTIVASPLTNISLTTVPVATLNLAKSVNLPFASIGSTLTYSFTITNTGSATASNVVFFDTIPNETLFIPPVLINGVPTLGNPQFGITIPLNIAPNQSTTLSFNVNIVSIPSSNTISNFADASYTFGVSSGRNTSNVVTTTINSANLSGITKSVNKSYATCGNIITYTISIPNTGNMTATNVIFSDTVPNGTTIVPGSVLVNGVPVVANPSSISLGNINPGATTTIGFSVQVQC